MTTFRDSRLQESLALWGPHIEGFPGRLDAISADIKSLEQYLDGKIDNPVVQILSELGRCPELEAEHHAGDQYPRAYGGEAAEGEIERLVFGRQGDRWRLMYVHSRAEGHLNGSGEYVWCFETPLDRRPLIECKAEIRMRAARALPEVLRSAARQCVADDAELEPEAEADAIPF